MPCASRSTRPTSKVGISVRPFKWNRKRSGKSSTMSQAVSLTSFSRRFMRFCCGTVATVYHQRARSRSTIVIPSQSQDWQRPRKSPSILDRTAQQVQRSPSREGRDPNGSVVPTHGRRTVFTPASFHTSDTMTPPMQSSSANTSLKVRTKVADGMIAPSSPHLAEEVT
jgi:hypothetical protein